MADSKTSWVYTTCPPGWAVCPPSIHIPGDTLWYIERFGKEAVWCPTAVEALARLAALVLALEGPG